jgi:hypothetical protein
MEHGLHFIGYLLAFFLAYLYFPNLVFKYGAEYSVDLGRKRDSGELEEFFSAVIPCVLLNAFTIALLRVMYLAGCPWTAEIDYDAVAAFMLSDHEAMHKFIVGEGTHHVLLAYVVSLLAVSWFNGTVFGFAVKRKLEHADLGDRRPRLKAGRSRPWRLWYRLFWIFECMCWPLIEFVAACVKKVWHPIYKAEVISLFPWTVQRPWIFVRMSGDRLYYGRFLRYDKTSHGNLESITIQEVQRYCFDEIDKCLADGRLPISEFQGDLRINVDEVMDIHTVPPNHFRTVEKRYQRLMYQRLGRELLEAFAGQEKIRVTDIYVRHGGGTFLGKHQYRQALRYLEDEGFITIDPTTVAKSPVGIPVDIALVTFPQRVGRRDFTAAIQPSPGISPILNMLDMPAGDA